MTLATRITDDLRASMKARDTVTTATLRMVLAAIKNLQVEAGRGGAEATDREVTELITKEAKKRREAAQTYRDVGRDDLADRELAELAVLERYLPEQLRADELVAIIDEAVEETGATGPGDMGRVMKEVMPRVKGRADGSAVQQAVRARLGGG
ncbi:MAG: GatB/YqeY domain-containing protein [Actinobacteria bacterium]|nr:GatB/YqeY domain-containing protein [Actinomycetota bacterium]